MSDRTQAQFDTERLEARLSHIDAGLDAVGSDLERLNRLATIGTAAGMIAHEVRGLLTPVLAYAQMARQMPDDVALARKAIEKAEQGASAAIKISETILALVGGVCGDQAACAESGERRESGVEVARAVAWAFDALGPAFEAAGVSRRVEVPTGLRAAMGDVELQQVLVNLFENALKAMAAGGEVSVTARCSTGNTGPGGVEIEIADTGSGMVRAVAARAFEPFFTDGGGAGSSGGRGAGLGLALCRALVAQARGRISVASEPGAGTRFRIVLPAG